MLAYDPLLSPAEVEAMGVTPWTWGTSSEARAIVTQTADPRWLELEAGWFPELRAVYDGRNSLRGLALPDSVEYHAVGVPASARRAAASVG
jgi:hypothetical protein